MALLNTKMKKKWIKSKENPENYLKIVLALKKTPSLCSIKDFFALKKIFKSIEETDLQPEEDSDDIYFERIHGNIIKTYEKELKLYASKRENEQLQSMELKKFFTQKYIKCTLCSDLNGYESLIETTAYKDHLLKIHDMTAISESDFLNEDSLKSPEMSLTKYIIPNRLYSEIIGCVESLEFDSQAEKIYCEILWSNFTEALYNTRSKLKSISEDSDILKNETINSMSSLISSLEDKIREYSLKIDILESKDREMNKLLIKNQLLENDIKNLRKNNSTLLTENNNISVKLDNLQKLSRKYINPNQKTHIISEENIIQEDRKKYVTGTSLDGSNGFHERRENGRFGSLSSFDNYGDDYNEKRNETDEF